MLKYASDVTIALASSDSTEGTVSPASLTFTPGDTSEPVTVQVVGDLLVEPTEDFFVNLSSPVNATIADGTYAPLSRPLFVYVKHGALSRPEVRAYVDFMLSGSEPARVGRAIGIPQPPC